MNGMNKIIEKNILPNSTDFKKVWEEKGPFKFALTSSEFPPVMLEPEEWIFSNDVTTLLKALMQFDKRKMKIVKSPFNRKNKKILRPDALSFWKINNFPEEWNACVCDIFAPEGHLNQVVIDEIKIPVDQIASKDVEAAFFQCLAEQIELLGYLLLKPKGTSKYAAVKKYLAEWEEDEQDAGLI